MVVEQRGSDEIGLGMLTIKEVAGLLHAHPSSVRRWAKEGLIKCYRVGTRGDRRFKFEHVDEFIQAGAESVSNGDGGQ
jgi:excisionase family DNA binding protein